jgi:Putative beta-barrel porin-2, OmpL-like. bbp2
MGKVTASLSWNDGFYSNRYSWLSGSLTYANGPHSLAFVGGGNYKRTAFQTLATPVQNNSSIYDVIYTYNKNGWIIQPYFQYTNVPDNAKIGVSKGASTTGGAILISRAFTHGFALPARWEYISGSGSAADKSVNLMFGPGSSGTSVNRDADIPIWRLLLPGRYCSRSRHRFNDRRRVWLRGYECEPGPSRGRNRIHIRQQYRQVNSGCPAHSSGNLSALLRSMWPHA